MRIDDKKSENLPKFQVGLGILSYGTLPRPVGQGADFSDDFGEVITGARGCFAFLALRAI